MFASFSVIDFRRLWFGIAFSRSSRWAMMLGIGWYMQALTHSPFWVGLAVFALQAPALIGAPLAGVLSDRFDRRHVLFATFVLSAVVSAALALVVLLHVATALNVVLLTFAVGLLASAQMTASSALLPTLVSPSQLLNAISLRGLAAQGSEFIGPAIASPLLAIFGPAAVFFLCTAFYIGACFVPLAMKVRPGYGAVSRRLFDPLIDGFRYVRGHRGLSVVIFYVAVHCVLTMAFMSVLPDFVQVQLGLGSSSFGLLMTLVGAGAISGVLVLTMTRPGPVQTAVYVASALISGLGLVLLGLTTVFAVCCVAVVLVGSSQTVFMALCLTRIQELADDTFRGRVSSVYLVLSMGTMAFANWFYGTLATTLPPSVILMMMGAAFAICVIFGSIFWLPLKAVHSGSVRFAPTSRVQGAAGD